MQIVIAGGKCENNPNLQAVLEERSSCFCG